MSPRRPNVTLTPTRPAQRRPALAPLDAGDDPRAVPCVYIYFDKPLQPRALLESPWTLRVSSWQYQLTEAEAFATHVRIATGSWTFDPGANRVRYNPIYPDLRDIDGLLVEPFVHPVIVV